MENHWLKGTLQLLEWAVLMKQRTCLTHLSVSVHEDEKLTHVFKCPVDISQVELLQE